MAKGVKFSKAAAQKIVDQYRETRRERPSPSHQPSTGGKISLSIAVGKTTEAIDKSTSGEVEIYRGGTLGDEDATGELVQAYNRYSDLADDVWVTMIFFGGAWQLIAAEC